MPIKNQVQLITYPNSLGGNLPFLKHILEESFSGCFSGIHILPPFSSTADRGFAPVTYYEIDPQFGDWKDIRQLSDRYDILLDFMVNHISIHSAYFKDFQQFGRGSKYADMFITLDKVWKGGIPNEADLKKIFLRRPLHPFLDVHIDSTGTTERIWATFGKLDTSEQIDLDVNSSQTRAFISDLAIFFADQGVNAIRLDAVAFVIKKAGTNCFFVEPEIYAFLSWIEDQFKRVGIDLLLEIHTQPDQQAQIAQHGYRVYNFVLPILMLHTIKNKDASLLLAHLKDIPHNQVTMLDCHDGIPVQPDIESILSIPQARSIVHDCLARGANLSRIYATEHLPDPTFDAHQINCTYYSALDGDDDAYILARAIQFFTPGIPQVYYVGLLAGENAPEEIVRTGERRAINRKNYTLEDIQIALRLPVVQRLVQLMRFRNEHPAFSGQFSILRNQDETFDLGWAHEDQTCVLHVDLHHKTCLITTQNDTGSVSEYRP